ncbi:nucleoid-associated protein [Pseudomonas alloputida]|uniref:Nucleoid-associated protein n=1 Tax=Pseudomonas alloputida TaxID=1940621 RepID=A0ABY3D3B0_9PSED|nr:nucleoid-associated protein [Pseudomonas alloputida]TRZ60033.1 nucleoid-associated protein [Pseudomonas alloputida]
MAFTLVHAVIHSFEKEKGTLLVDRSKTVKKALFDPKKPTVISLAEGIHGLLGKKGNNVVWGQFESNGRQGRFPKSTETFSKGLSAENFEALTHVALGELIEQAKLETFSTGGHTLFAYYVSDAIPFILVANIKQRNGLRLGPDYIPEESVDIDMSKVHQACRINLARFSETLALLEDTSESNDNESEEAPDKTYLCFISKGRDSEASAYFIKGLGCTPGIASTRATANAIEVIEDFFRDRDELAPFTAQAKDNVITYLSKKQQDEQKATLQGIQTAASAAIPPEQADLVEMLEALPEILNSEESKIPEEFTVSKAILDKKTKIKGKSSRWSAQFDRSALSTSPDSIVCYNSAEATITFSDIPEAMKKMIESELNGRIGS